MIVCACAAASLAAATLAFAAHGVGGRVGLAERRAAADPGADARASPTSPARCRRPSAQALDAKLADWEAQHGQPARRADGADDAAGVDRGVLDPRRRSVEDRPEGQGQWRDLPRRQGRQADAHRSRLRPRRRADRCHVAPHHRRDRRAALQQGPVRGGYQCRRRSHHRGRRARASRCRRHRRAATRDASSAADFDFGTLFIVLFVAVPVLGGILRSMFGKRRRFSRSARGIVGAVAWFVAGSLVDRRHRRRIAFSSCCSRAFGGRGGRHVHPGRRRRWWRLGGGGGGFSGGGGGFGGGGASGGWMMENDDDHIPAHSPYRFWRHFVTDHRCGAARVSPRIARSASSTRSPTARSTHSGQVCFAVEAALAARRRCCTRLHAARARARGVRPACASGTPSTTAACWSIVLLADQDVEIVADRGIDRR